MVLLRYFNPVGAHESGLIGEDPKGIPNNLICIRDYIHVVDLALGHVAALDKCMNRPGTYIYNLGTGTGYSVLDMVKAFSKAIGRELPYRFAPRRAGDVVTCYADPMKARKELGWTASKTLDDMTADSYNWQKNNPNGFED